MAVSGTAAPGAAGLVLRPRLFARLDRPQRIFLVSGPPGSGKTDLVRSWIWEVGLGARSAWLTIDSEERDPQRLCVAVLRGLADIEQELGLVHGVTAAPSLDLEQIMERLLEDLSGLEDPVYLIIDDLEELLSGEAMRLLELFIMRAPPELRVVLCSRQDLRLGLHRRRLAGEVVEIRGTDLQFSPEEARQLFAAAGLALSEKAVATLHACTEGWAAGLRLAAMSLVDHPDPERFAAEFSGTERTVADYLLAEVLDRQPPDVRRLLLRTSILERVNGALADRLADFPGAERALQELEEANAFVVAIDASRTWFRYHHLFADLLRLELRRSEPELVPVLGRTASLWLAEHGRTVEAVRQAMACGEWELAARQLADEWLELRLDGLARTRTELLAALPPAFADDPEVLLMRAGDEIQRGLLDEAEGLVATATRRSPRVAPERRGEFACRLGIARLTIARGRTDLEAVRTEAQTLLSPPGAGGSARRSELRRALALIELGTTELWALQLRDADRHLETGTELAARIGRPYLEIDGLGHRAMGALFRSPRTAMELGSRAVELAAEHGWAEESIASVAYVALGAAVLWPGHLDDADHWLGRGLRAAPPEAEPMAGVMLHYDRALLALARESFDGALEALSMVPALAEHLVQPQMLTTKATAVAVHALVRRGDLGTAAGVLEAQDESERDRAELRGAEAALRIAAGDPEAALDLLAPVLGEAAQMMPPPDWRIQPHVLEALARDALGDARGSRRALERALDLAEPSGAILPFLLLETRPLLERHERLRTGTGTGTAHPALVSTIRDIQRGRAPAAGLDAPPHLREPLSNQEIRVLRYLPTHLSIRDIAGELYLSVNTIKVHIRNLYRKLGAHSRAEAVERARALGLLAPSAERRPGRR